MLLPDDPAKRLDYVIRKVFDGSPKALAIASGVSRTAVNKWPPDDTETLDRHLAKAIEHEMRVTEERRQMLFDFHFHMRDRLRKYRDDRLAEERR